jgi:hypothetical protein
MRGNPIACINEMKIKLILDSKKWRGLMGLEVYEDGVNLEVKHMTHYEFVTFLYMF